MVEVSHILILRSLPPETKNFESGENFKVHMESIWSLKTCKHYLDLISQSLTYLSIPPEASLLSPNVNANA